VSEVPDISNLDYSQLSQLRAAVAERMKEMRDTGITQLRATIAEQAQLLGIAVDDLLPKKKSGRARAVTKYRDPGVADHTWSGRGKHPAWLKDKLEQGHTLDEFLISSA
jgi:DNA-binding protein H-NS